MEKEQHDIDGNTLQPQLDMEQKLTVELVRMAKQRHVVPCPDADTEWNRIASQLEDHGNEADCTPSDGDNAVIRRLKLWAVAATAAAAVFAGVLGYTVFMHTNNAESVVALAYDETPQHITLRQDNGQITDLSDKDSITYYNKVSAAASAGTKQQQLSTPRGMDFKVILPDGSEVWLNAESTIKFPSSFLQSERRVELTGEAYFKVAHNARKPFLVTTERMNVKVLGTEFNMRNYKSEAPQVSLVKGSVLVINPDSKAAECRLTPGQAAWRDSKGAFHVSSADTYGVTQWVDGFFYFDDVPLVSILRELGRWYNLGVIINRPAAASLKLHFSASRKDDINEALSNINNMLDVNVSVEGTDIVVK